jgi:inosose dehydratase
MRDFLVHMGFKTGLHHHTGTCIESRDEVYAVMSGQQQESEVRSRCGAAAKGRRGRCAGGKGLPAARYAYALEGLQEMAVLRSLLSAGYGHGRHSSNPRYGGGCRPEPDVMVGLDPSLNDGPMSPLETVKATKAYLEKLGYNFRT